MSEQSKKFGEELRKLADAFLSKVKEYVDVCVLMRDLGKIERLASVVNMQMGYEVVKNLRDKGFSMELSELCDRAGEPK